MTHLREGAHPRSEQNFVLDDVSDAGENRLVEQNVGDFRPRKRSHSSSSPPWDPIPPT